MGTLWCSLYNTKHCSLFISIILVIHLATNGSTQAEGDVRLSGGKQLNFGILEIYWKEIWSTFCGISRGGAQAACRQLGFLDYMEYYPFYKSVDSGLVKASQDTPIAIANTFCSYKPPTSGQLHILGCGISIGVRYSCTHDKDIVVRCKNISLWKEPYDTEVRLTGGNYLSSGVLEIYLFKRWGNVCGNIFNKGAADSVCRQMGYTSATSFSTASNSSISNSRHSNSSASFAWLSSASCNTSCNCFRSCYIESSIKNFSCEHTNLVSLSCTYDVTRSNEPGSESRCSKVSGEVCVGKRPSLSFGIIMLIVILVLVLALILVVISTLFVFSTPVYKEKAYILE